MNYLDQNRLQVLAANYALGTMSARAVRRFSAVLRNSVEAQRAVDVWHERLSMLSTSIPSVTPRNEVWQQIVKRTASPLPPREKPSGAWWWPALGSVAGAFLVVALIQVEPRWLGVNPTSTVALAPSYVGLLTNTSNEPAVVVSSLRHGRVLNIKVLRPLNPPVGKTMQLWALPVGGRAVHLGAIPVSGKTVLQLSDTSERLFALVPRLAVSFEPGEMQPDAQPSAPFELSGHCVKLW